MRRHARRRVVGAVVTVILAVAGVPVVSEATSRPAAASDGVAVNAAPSTVAQRAGMSVGPTILWASDAQQAADLDAVAASGATWLTLDIDWNHIQYDSRDTWRWNAATDRVVLNARHRGLKIIGVAAYSPPWARGAECPPGELHCLPANPADYARFMRAAAARYGSQSPIERLRGSVTVWSLWNEPNHREFSMPRPDPDRYAAMVKLSYPAIKAVDPTATVVTGGTAPAPDAADGSDYTPETWLRGLYARGAGGSFDAVGHHPYSFPVNPLDAHWWNAFTQTQTLYDVMVANGDGAKKVWGTEMGAPTGSDPQAITEAQQVRWVQDYYRGWNTTFRAFTGPLVWFELHDEGSDRGDRWQNLGLQYLDRTPKPAYAAYQQVMGSGIFNTPSDLTGLTIPKPGRRVVTNPRGGYYTLAASGAVTAFDGAPYLGSPVFPSKLARGLAVMPDGLGYLVLDGYGGVHKFGSAAVGVMGRRNAGYFGFDIARDITLTPSGRGYSVLDGYGGVHTSGAAPAFRYPYWSGWDIARAFAYSPTGSGAYLLDGFGGMHVNGDAVARRTGSWPGRDFARDVIVSPDNAGYAVVDAYGGVHRAGSAPRPGANWAYQRWDHAGGVAFVNGGYVVAG